MKYMFKTVRHRVSIILVLCMLISSVFVSKINTVSAQEVDSDEYNEAFEALKTFGILEDNIEYSQDALVCREDMALYAAKMLGLKQQSSSERFYVDVPMDSYGTWAINALTRMGIFSVDEEHKFRPMDTVDANELYKVITTILGYENYAKVNGGYPGGYALAMNAAKLNKISSGQVSFEELVVLMYDAMQAEMYEQVTFGDNIEMKKAGNTILSVYHNVEFREGTVETIGSASVFNSGETDRDEIQISGEKYKYSESIYLPDYLAKYVKFFYSDKADEPKTLKYICGVSGKEDIEVQIKDVSSIHDDSIAYWVDDKEKKQSLTKSLWLYNGRVLEKDVEKTLSELNKGDIIIRDSDNDGGYDTVLVWDYSSFVIKSKNDEKETIYNKLDIGGEIKKDDFQTVRVYDEKKNELNWLDLSQGMVLSVARSQDSNVMVVIASTAEFNGNISEKIENPKKIKVNDEYYEIEPSYIKEFTEKGFVVGEIYKFKTDSFGYIAYVYSGESDASMKYGYIIDSYVNTDSMFEEFKVKILTQDDKIDELKMAQTVRVDGARYKDVSGIANAFPGFSSGKISPQMIRYEQDAEGLIKKVDTIKLNPEYETEDNSMTVVGDENFGIKWYRLGRIGLLSWVDSSNTLMYSIPLNDNFAKDDPDNYKTQNASSALTDDSCYYTNIYTTSKRSEYCDAILRKYEDDDIGKNYGRGVQLMLVDEIGDALDEEGNVVKCITGMVEGNRISYNIPSNVSVGDIDRGDIIKFRYNIRGKIIPTYDNDTDIIVLYDYSKYKGEIPTEWEGNTTDLTLYKKVNNAAFHNYRNTMQLSYGYASEKSENVLWWGAKTGSEPTEMYRVSNIGISVYDSSQPSNQQVYKGSIDDIDDFKTVGDKCSRVILHSYIGQGKALFVYK